MKIKSIYPYDGSEVSEYDQITIDDATQIISDVRLKQKAWGQLEIKDRALIIAKAAGVLETHKQKYAELMTKEMGKPITQSVAEVEKCAMLCTFYAENAERFMEDEMVDIDGQESFVRFEPLGIVFAIMPWNFPLWQVFRCAVPSLLAGNGCVLKHASNVPGSALACEEVFEEAGLGGLFRTLIIDSKTATQVVEKDLVEAVSLTGSNAAGASIGRVAGGNVRRIVLELGGSDPFIVLEDADIDKAVSVGVASRMVNTGQSCIAAKRFIVSEKIIDEFSTKFVSAIKALKVGDPMDSSTEAGPVARSEFVNDLQVQLDDAQAKGATIERNPYENSTGYFFAPTVVLNPTHDMKVLTEEVFGPMAPIISFSTEEEAIEIANDTEFGLGGAIWSKDLDRADTLSRQIQSGFVAINDMVKSDARLPFGGIKKSGVGRELSHYGLKEFVNIKTVVCKE